MCEKKSSEYIVLIPVYNDWLALSKLLNLLSQQLERTGKRISILLVNDGSSLPTPALLTVDFPDRFNKVSVLSLRRNLGHQRAIAIGLCYIEANISCSGVVVMDGDGEDLPEHVPLLIDKCEASDASRIIFAERTRRTETLMFRLFYKLYKRLHLLMIGERVRVGNFSVLPYKQLRRLVCVSDLWNHYAAAIFKARLPTEMVPLNRGHRLDGKSQMNFISLVTHGLSAMSVYGDRIGVRLLSVASLAICLLIAILLAMVAVRFGLNIVLPNYVKTFSLILLLTVPQLLMLSLIFALLVLAGRDSSLFLPLRDYTYFVDFCEELALQSIQRDVDSKIPKTLSKLTSEDRTKRPPIKSSP